MDNIKLVLQLTSDQTDDIVVSSLKEDYKNLLIEIKKLECIEKISDVNCQNLKDNKKYLKGIKRCLTYYMPSNDAKSFIKEMDETYG